MTRSHKFGERDYSVEVTPGDMLPKYFAKAGYEGTDPKKVKKEGGGKGNWGRPASELEDVKYNPVRPRRRSNSISFTGTRDFRTKFEEIEAEPVFEDHMAEMLEDDRLAELDRASKASESVVDSLDESNAHEDYDLKLEHSSTSLSDVSGASVDEERM